MQEGVSRRRMTVRQDNPLIIVVQPNFDVVFTAPSPREEAAIARFAERTGHNVDERGGTGAIASLPATPRPVAPVVVPVRRVWGGQPPNRMLSHQTRPCASASGAASLATGRALREGAE